MTWFTPNAVVTVEALSRGTANISIGSSTRNYNQSCEFRNLQWSPDSSKEKLPLIFQTRNSIEIHRGITRSESSTPHHPDSEAGSWSRDGISLHINDRAFCDATFQAMRAMEKEIAEALKSQGESRPLTRVTKHMSDSPLPIWLSLKSSQHPCASFIANSTTNTYKEVDLRELTGRSGMFQLSFQATSLFLQRNASQWRISFALRTILLIEGHGTESMQMISCIRSHTEGLRLLSAAGGLATTRPTNELAARPSAAPPNEPAAVEHRPTPTAAANISQASSAPTPAAAASEPAKKKRQRKPKAPACGNAPPPTTAANAAVDSDADDWPGPPLKKLVSGRAAGTRIASKEIHRGKPNSSSSSSSSSESESPDLSFLD